MITGKREGVWRAFSVLKMGNVWRFECDDENYPVEKESQVMEGAVLLHKTLWAFSKSCGSQGRVVFPGGSIKHYMKDERLETTVKCLTQRK